MLGITDRYILLEVLKVFLAVFGTVMLIVVSMLFLRTLEEVNTGVLGSDLVLRFMGLQVARDISSLIPPIFFISVLMALGRMARDSELIAFAACGLGPVQTYRSLFYAAIPIAILTAWFSFYVRPIVVGDLQELRERQKDQAYQISGLKAGRFYQQGDGKIINVSSACDRRSWQGCAVYSAAKAGVNAFSKCLYTELRPHGVCVTLLVPGGSNTGFQDAAEGVEDFEWDESLAVRPEHFADMVYQTCALSKGGCVTEMLVYGLAQDVSGY